MKPKTILADILYGGDDNSELAKTHNVDLVSPTFKKDNNRGLGSFRFDDQGRVTSCPVGHSPIKVSYKKKTRRYRGRFDLKHCIAYPHVANCPVKAGKKNYYFLRYSDKDYRLTVRRRFENSEPFIDSYRRRAGVEATMSQYDALTGVKRLRVRSFKAVRFCATLRLPDSICSGQLWSERLKAGLRLAQRADFHLFGCLFHLSKNEFVAF